MYVHVMVEDFMGQLLHIKVFWYHIKIIIRFFCEFVCACYGRGFYGSAFAGTLTNDTVLQIIVILVN